jgi:hypothetical protein
MHAQISPRSPQPLSFLSTTRQAGVCTQSTTPPHLSATGVNPSHHQRQCSGQGTGSSTSKLTPPICLSDQTSARSRSPASRIVPRRGRSPVRAPSPPSYPQPAPATSPRTRCHARPHAASPSVSLTCAERGGSQEPSGARSLSLPHCPRRCLDPTGHLLVEHL